MLFALIHMQFVDQLVKMLKNQKILAFSALVTSCQSLSFLPCVLDLGEYPEIKGPHQANRVGQTLIKMMVLVASCARGLLWWMNQLLTLHLGWPLLVFWKTIIMCLLFGFLQCSNDKQVIHKQHFFYYHGLYLSRNNKWENTGIDCIFLYSLLSLCLFPLSSP